MPDMPEQQRNKGGRPVKGRKKYKLKWLPLALQLHKEGKSLREVAKEVSYRAGKKISHTSLGVWIREAQGTATKKPTEPHGPFPLGRRGR